MRRPVSQRLVPVAIALGLVGCGAKAPSGSSATGASSGGSSPAARTVVAAVTRLAHESYREDVTVHTRYDTSGLAASVASRFAAAPTLIIVDGAIETPRRLSIVENIPPTLENVHVVVYDGATYVAIGGDAYRTLTGAPATSVNSLTALGVAGLAAYLTDVRSGGRATIAGQPAAHYTAGLDPAGIRALTAKLTGPLHVNADAVGVTANRVDIYLNQATGQIVELVTTDETTLDLDKLVAPPTATAATKLSGTLKLQQVSTAELSAFGAKLNVSPPPAAG